MHVSEPPCDPYKHPVGHPYRGSGPEKHETLKLMRKGLDALGLLALLAAAVLLFASGIIDDNFDSGRLIRISIATLNISVLVLASARLLDMISRARHSRDPGDNPFEPKRSGDPSMRTAPHPEVGSTETAIADSQSPNENKSNGEILYSSAWRPHAQDTAASDDPGSAATRPTPALRDTSRLQNTDSPDETSPKSIH